MRFSVGDGPIQLLLPHVTIMTNCFMQPVGALNDLKLPRQLLTMAHFLTSDPCPVTRDTTAAIESRWSLMVSGGQ